MNISGKMVSSHKNRIRTPWHLWPIGLFFFSLYAYGAYDYFMMLSHNDAYYMSKGYGPIVYAYFTDYPVIPAIFWTTNIVAGLITPILLLFRSRFAFAAALISLVSLLCLDLLTFAFRNRWNVLGPWVSTFDIGIVILTFGLCMYIRQMGRRGVL